MKKEEIKINNVEVESFRNSDEIDVIILSWQGNIGWGEYTLYKEKDSDQWKGDSECMDSNEDKSFLKMLLDKFVENVNVK